MPQLAFAGLGAMGSRMALHLSKSGFSVIGFDIFEPAMQRMVTEGVQCASSPMEAARNASIMLCMVANADQATSLFFDADTGAASALPPKATILILSTVPPSYIQHVRQTLDERDRTDVFLVDCPVSGGVTKAANGTLSIFSSEEGSELEPVHTVLQCLSSKLYRIPGGLGKGSQMKLVQQTFAGIHIAVSSEAMGLAAAVGLSPRYVFDEIVRSDSNSWMFENRVYVMIFTCCRLLCVNVYLCGAFASSVFLCVVINLHHFMFRRSLYNQMSTCATLMIGPSDPVA